MDKKTRAVNKYAECFDVYIGRGSNWGNPFTHHPKANTIANFQVDTREESIEAYRKWIQTQIELGLDKSHANDAFVIAGGSKS